MYYLPDTCDFTTVYRIHSMCILKITVMPYLHHAASGNRPITYISVILEVI